MFSESTALPTPFEGRLDAAAYIERTPPNVTCKGIFFTDVLATARRLGGKEVHARLVAAFGNRYLAFRDYPLREHMALTAMAVPLMFPQLSEREGMRRLGWQVYEGFQQTTIGRVVFSALGIDLESVLVAGPRAFQVCLSHGRATAARIGPGHWRYRMREFFGYLDTYYVGACEGPIMASGLRPDVTLQADSPSDGTMEIRWK